MKCKMIRKKFTEASLGPIADEQLTVAPAFYLIMAYTYGPCQIFFPGHTMEIRHRNILEAKWAKNESHPFLHEFHPFFLTLFFSEFHPFFV